MVGILILLAGVFIGIAGAIMIPKRGPLEGRHIATAIGYAVVILLGIVWGALLMFRIQGRE
jgi:hypothetical protein